MTRTVILALSALATAAGLHVAGASATDHSSEPDEPPRVCQLGKSCMDLSAKPFEVCATGLRRCSQEVEVIPATRAAVWPDIYEADRHRAAAVSSP
jgi:hypothetical protein